MTKADGGWYELLTDAVRLDSGYQFRLQDGMRVPDPAAPRPNLGCPWA